MAKTIQAILNLKDNFSNTLKNTTNNTKQFQRQMQQTSNKAKEMQSAIIGSFGKIAGGIGLLEIGRQSIMLASNLKEVQNVVDTTFGGGADTINKWSQTALKSFGLSELQAKQFNGTIGALLKSSGISSDQLTDMSTALSGLSADFASFYNLDPAEAFDKIKSGISGETEPLKSLGINMSVANLQAYALSQGIKKSWNEMSQAEQVQLRYNYLMMASKDAQGDFAKTNQGFANQLRIATETLKQIGATIASYALPGLNNLLIGFNTIISTIPGMIDGFSNMGGSLQSITSFAQNVFTFFSNNWGLIAPIISGVAGAILFFNGALKTIEITTTIVKAVQEAWTVAIGACNIAMGLLNGTLMITPLGWITLLVGGLIAVGVALWQNWDAVSAKASELWGALTGAFSSIGDTITGVFNSISSSISGFINYAIDGINSLIEGFNSLTGIKLPDWLGGGSFDLNIPTIPHFATGTQYFSGGLAKINERGGELVNLPNGSQVIPADKTDKILNGSGGTTVQVIVQGNVIGNHEFVNEMGQIITDKLKLALLNN